MGPLTILDKSAFQSPSKDEHFHFRWHFYEVLAPVLVAELAADLSKKVPDGGIPADEVAVLARKFGGSGGPVSMDHRTLCIHSLIGGDVPMDGRLVPDNMTTARFPEGDVGAFVDLSPLNHLIVRLADKRASKVDVEFAERWRATTNTLSMRRLNDFANDHHLLVVPRQFTGRGGDGARRDMRQHAWSAERAPVWLSGARMRGAGDAKGHARVPLLAARCDARMKRGGETVYAARRQT